MTRDAALRHHSHAALRMRQIAAQAAQSARPTESWWAKPMTREQFTDEARRADARMNACSQNYRHPEDER